MKRDVLNRYERGSDGSILIDVAADRVEDLYSDFDRSAPYIRRDLDQDLVDYLIDCARELESEPFTISFSCFPPYLKILFQPVCPARQKSPAGPDKPTLPSISDSPFPIPPIPVLQGC